MTEYVRHKTGGPVMSVSAKTTEGYRCHWLADNDPCEFTFPASVLHRVTLSDIEEPKLSSTDKVVKADFGKDKT